MAIDNRFYFARVARPGSRCWTRENVGYASNEETALRAARAEAKRHGKVVVGFFADEPDGRTVTLPLPPGA